MNPRIERSVWRPLLGRVGEALAVEYLKRFGYRILERNYRCRAGEIDIVAKEGAVLAFVEVRSKTTVEFGTPLETLRGEKQAKLRRAAACYLVERSIDCDGIRFDAVGVLWPEACEPRLELVKDAFRRGMR